MRWSEEDGPEDYNGCDICSGRGACPVCYAEDDENDEGDLETDLID